jgi:hypothetical protein
MSDFGAFLQVQSVPPAIGNSNASEADDEQEIRLLH